MDVLVRYFAIVRERIGLDVESLSLPEDATVEHFWSVLKVVHPDLISLRPHLRVAVNQAFADSNHKLSAGDEIALIPPVAGGHDGDPDDAHVALRDSRLDPTRLNKLVTGPTRGGLVTFVGTVRNHSKGNAVEYLEYEVYPEMALLTLRQVLDEAKERWPECAAAVEHRYGRLEIGDAAVVIAVASAHRNASFEAAAFIIDRIKEIVPIWKREVGPDGSEWVGMGS